MAPGADASGLTTFTGWDLRGGVSPDQGAPALRSWASSAPAGTVVGYDLLAVAARGFRPPRYLTIADHPGDTSGDHGPGTGPDEEALRVTWSVAYRRLVEQPLRSGVPHAIYLLGVNPPADATDQDLDEFNAFYDDVHLPEVAERRHALRAVRYQLDQEVKAPPKGAPRFLAIYEVDEAGASQRRHVGPPYTSGPPVWQGHRTPWRLWYRLLGGDGEE